MNDTERAELRERLDRIDPVTGMVNLILGVRWVTRKPRKVGPMFFYEVRFGARLLGMIARRSTTRGGGHWRALERNFPTLRAAERALVEHNIGWILEALTHDAKEE